MLGPLKDRFRCMSHSSFNGVCDSELVGQGNGAAFTFLPQIELLSSPAAFEWPHLSCWPFISRQHRLHAVKVLCGPPWPFSNV